MHHERTPVRIAVSSFGWAWVLIAASALLTIWIFALAISAHGIRKNLASQADIATTLLGLEDAIRSEFVGRKPPLPREVDTYVGFESVRVRVGADPLLLAPLERSLIHFERARTSTSDRLAESMRSLDELAVAVKLTRGRTAAMASNLGLRWTLLTISGALCCILTLGVAVVCGLYRRESRRRRSAERAMRESSADLEATMSAYPDLYFWIDADGTIRRFHAGFQTYVPPDDFLNRRMQDVLPPEVAEKLDRAIRELLATESVVAIEYSLPMSDDIHFYEARLSLLANGSILIVVRDTTERILEAQSRTKLIEQLQLAADEVHTLQGLVPICAWCKKIRDDGGFWHQVESYLETRTALEFSHGICPNCAEHIADLRTDPKIS